MHWCTALSTCRERARHQHKTHLLSGLVQVSSCVPHGPGESRDSHVSLDPQAMLMASAMGRVFVPYKRLCSSPNSWLQGTWIMGGVTVPMKDPQGPLLPPALPCGTQGKNGCLKPRSGPTGAHGTRARLGLQPAQLQEDSGGCRKPQAGRCSCGLTKLPPQPAQPRGLCSSSSKSLPIYEATCCHPFALHAWQTPGTSFL